MPSASPGRLFTASALATLLTLATAPIALAQGAEEIDPVRKPLVVPPGTMMATPIPTPPPGADRGRPTVTPPVSKPAAQPSPQPTAKPEPTTAASPVPKPRPEQGAEQEATEQGTIAVPAPKPETELAGFAKWVNGFKVDTAKTGKFTAEFLDTALTNVRFIPRVIELDRRQPESTLTHATYLDRVVGAVRIREGRENFRENRDALMAVEAKYGVPAEVITALWGIETSYGQITGGFRVLDALASLAYEGRRREFFQTELVNLLTIIREEERSPDDFQGSWAGAMGQSQFMPSSFLAYAVDHDGDGKRDIWGTKADVFASAANYLKQSGWKADERWGRQVTLPAGFDRALVDGKTVKPLTAWQELGLRLQNGADLPTAGTDFTARLIQPDGRGGPAFLVYGNYDVILRWNRSNYFATAVGILSDRIAEER